MAWIMGPDGFPTNTEFIAAPEKAMTAPFPDAMWRIDPLANDGFPFTALMPRIQKLNLRIQPSKPLLHVYGNQETDFDGNGYAIIEPISCEVYQEKGGTYQATIETYRDDYRKYTYLKKQAPVKIPIKYHGKDTWQVFRILVPQRKMDNSGNQRITAEAMHIFYDLNRYLIKSCHPTQLNGREALDYIFSHGWYGGNGTHPFSYSSDIPNSRTAYYDNMSVTAALLGADQSFINRWGGCLYRDNYRFSINKETEGCRKSGIIQYGYNMEEIEFVEDDTELLTVLIAEDNFGNFTRIENPDVPNENIPHHIYRYVKLYYETEDREAFLYDAQAYYDNYKQSSVYIKVKFANIAELEMYKDFLQLDSFEVGDRVTIYHKDLDIYYSNLEIISKRFDAVNQRTMEIEIGSFKDAISRSPYMSQTIGAGQSAVSKELIAVGSELSATNTRLMSTNIAALQTYTIAELMKRTINELEGK